MRFHAVFEGKLRNFVYYLVHLSIFNFHVIISDFEVSSHRENVNMFLHFAVASSYKTQRLSRCCKVKTVSSSVHPEINGEFLSDLHIYKKLIGTRERGRPQNYFDTIGKSRSRREET